MRVLATRLSILAVALLVTATLAACAPDDGVPAATGGDVPEVVIEASDYSFSAPAEVKAGMTKVTLTNTGQELHNAPLLYLKDGKSFEDFAAEMELSGPEGAMPDWVESAGGPGPPVPGGSASAFVDLKPGNYVMLCPIPNAEGVPHMNLGMIRPMRVVASDAPAAAAPAADITVTGTDFAFGAESEMAAGSHVMGFQNDGQQDHELVLFKLNEGASAADIVAAFEPGGSGQPPAMPLGGVIGVPAGGFQSFPVDLTPGRYALLCFYPDLDSGKMHIELGMTDEFEVK